MGSAHDGIAAIKLIEELAPDVAIVDLTMPTAGGIEIAERFRDADSRILLLSAHDTPNAVHRCLAAGAAGYLTKDASADCIRDAIRAVARGELVVDEALGTAVLDHIKHADVAESSKLSARETAVLELAAEGLTAAQIGRSLHISEGTVKTYLGRAYDKLGVSERSAAVAQAMRRGLIS